ncbi:MAG: hypothetical protein HUU16_09510 [Candidatus Omnitrophica bacterium]|nr:hypothetical protein [Candidatus Omnitrophota bacterium]
MNRMELPEFYVGYHPTAPSSLAGLNRNMALTVALGMATLMALGGGLQNPIDRGAFEFGVRRVFEGVLYETPLPVLRLTAPFLLETEATSLLLVGFGKSGIPRFAQGHHGKKVRFEGSLIHRDNMTMVEMNAPESFAVLGDPLPEEERPRFESLGEATLVGELVDTKCFFGVMRPATGKVHRACAIRCLSGGVPPGLLIRDSNGDGVVVMLAGPDGTKLEFDIQLAARVVKASGILEMQEDIPVLRTREVKLTEGRE